MDEAIVEEADDEARLPGHRRMNGMARKEVAEEVVLAIRRSAADLIARIEVAHSDGNPLGLEKRLDPFTQKEADILELHITGSIALIGVGCQQVLAGAFRNGDDGVGLHEHPCFRAARNASSANGTSGTSAKFTSWLATVAPAVIKPA